MAKKALITGVTGQDGSYLAELLLNEGSEVHVLIQRASTLDTRRIDRLYADPHDPECRFFLHYADLSDGSRLPILLDTLRPDEVYHLAAQSHVRVSFDEPEFTEDVNGAATTRLLEARTLRADRPDDFVLATDEVCTARDFEAAPSRASPSTGRNMCGSTSSIYGRRRWTP